MENRYPEGDAADLWAGSEGAGIGVLHGLTVERLF